MPELVVPAVFILYLSTTYVYDELPLPYFGLPCRGRRQTVLKIL